MAFFEVLTPEMRKHIAEHKYKGGKYTPLDNLLNNWWLFLTNQLPRSMAPNLVTFCGFVPCVLSYSLSWYYTPEFETPSPGWVYLFASVSLFIYQTFDAMDGKQARRIGLSTPMGQLFDHGFDCLACISHHSMAASVLLPGASRWPIAGMTVFQTGFFFSQWQEHYTGILETSFGPVGVTETQYALMLLSLSGYLLDTGTFFKAPSVLGFTAGELAILGWIIFCGVLMSISFCKTLAAASSVLVDVPCEAVPPEKRLQKALMDLIPMVSANAVVLFGWNPEINAQAPRIICLGGAILFFYLTAHMIILSMARTPYWAPTCVLPYAAVAISSRFLGAENALRLAIALDVVIALWVGLWLYTVMGELKETLNIYIFSTKKWSRRSSEPSNIGAEKRRGAEHQAARRSSAPTNSGAKQKQK